MKPLDGVRVIDLTRVLAGPYCSLILADLGAEVIKVETPGQGDDARAYGPFIGGKSAYFLSLNRNKKSVALDLKTPQGKVALSRLLAEADILIENYRPGTLNKLGFPWTRLQEINPGLICCHISGFGQTGPYRDRPAYDIIAQAMGGIMSITGQPAGVPTRVGASVADITAGLYATVGILAALRVKAETGLGQEIDISMLDCQVAILENAIARYTVSGESPEPIGNRHPSITPFTSVSARDGYIIIAAGNDVLWQKLCRMLGSPDLADDARFKTNSDRTENWEQLRPILDELFSARSVAEWLELLSKEGLPCGPINNVAQMVADPQVKAREMIWEIDVDGACLGVSGNPIKLSLTPADEIYLPPPDLGEHDDEILR
ncbi:MAG: CoA transferase [Chloroflexi bacterium]|nr:CoA transferase [Chloroflexota bacterium]